MPLTKEEIQQKIQRKKLKDKILLIVLILLVTVLLFITVIEPLARRVRCGTNPDGSQATAEEFRKCFDKDGVYMSPETYFWGSADD